MSIKDKCFSQWDRHVMNKRKKLEMNKINNPRRKAIYEPITLTNDQKRQIDALYKENYGACIPYAWHRYYSAFNGKLDPTYLPETLYIPEFEHYMNLWPSYISAIEDKNLLPLIANSMGIKMPKTLLSCTRGIYRDESLGMITRGEAIEALGGIGRVFIKPSVDSSSGNGCGIADFVQGTNMLTGRTADETLKSLGNNFAVQEVITCHDDIRRIYPGGVNTFRVITYIWKESVCYMPSIMRIGKGGSVLDNAHAGGIFISVSDGGQLGDTAITEFNTRFTEHPDTGARFESCRIEAFPAVKVAAKKMHEAIPQIGVINWDFTIDSNGSPVMIEANLRNGSAWLPQMAHGCGPFGERTAEVLRWMRFMKNTEPSNRKSFAYGHLQ